jgi:hypothetical protein
MSTLTPNGQPAVRSGRRAIWRGLALWTAFAAVVIVGVLLAASHGSSVPALLDGARR